MSTAPELNDEVHEDDIIFECPHCGKSIAIDPRGGGMVVACPDCQARVQVPSWDDEVAAAGVTRKLDRLRAENIDHFEEIGKELALIQAAMDRIVAILQDGATENASQ